MEKKQKRTVIRNKPIPEAFRGKVYLDPTYDPAFKELFDNEDALKDFLNIEMQRLEHEKRRYQLPETISVWICDFDLPEAKNEYWAAGKELAAEARGESKGEANAISVFEKLGASPEMVAQAKAMLSAEKFELQK